MNLQRNPEMQYPGVPVVEVHGGPMDINARPASVAAFIGYTIMAKDADGKSLINKPVRLTSLIEFENFFGGPQNEKGLLLTISNSSTAPPALARTRPSLNTMHAAIRLYFDNGGIACYILSVGYASDDASSNTSLLGAIDILEQCPEPGIYCFPGSQWIKDEAAFYAVYAKAIDSCEKLKDRFTLVDCWPEKTDTITAISHFRNRAPHNTGFGKMDHLSFGAAYYPYLLVNFKYPVDEKDIAIANGTTNLSSLADLRIQQPALYTAARKAVDDSLLIMPPSPAIAGTYAATDNARGVWKAPANVALNSVFAPASNINESEQGAMNIDPVSGKSVNAIRVFTGKGILVRGARTLAGNDNEWRYVPVRRLFSVVESSVSQALQQLVFEKNEAATWVRVISMVSNFLFNYWKNGALMGSKPGEAYFVHCGLGQTMTQQDISNGVLILEIGMAAVRPAEFIIIRLSQKVAS